MQENGAKPEDFYANLKEQLNANHQFPTYYVYKFIIDNQAEKIHRILSIFIETKHSSEQRTSKNGKYVSVNINAWVNSSDQVIEFYKKVSKIEKVMML